MLADGPMLVPGGIVAAICLMILCSILGNLLVVLSVLLVRRLRQPANLLLLSLAVTGEKIVVPIIKE